MNDKDIYKLIKEFNALLTRRQVAEMLGIDENTPSVWKSKGKGPAAITIGRTVRYRLSDVEKFIEKRKGKSEL